MYDANGNSFALFIFLEDRDTIVYVIRNILIMVVVYRNFPKDLKIVEKLRRKFLLESSDSLSCDRNVFFEYFPFHILLR